MEELALVRHHATRGTTLFQPEPLAEAEAFRVLSEFDSDRAELFLARAALLVEGRTEKMTFPLVFEALGIEPDKEGIIVVECGGKGNMPLFARVCNACGVPYVVVHDRDAPKGLRPVESERVVNQQILEVAGRRRTVVLTPDFEAVSGVSPRCRGRKTAQGLPPLLHERRGSGHAAHRRPESPARSSSLEPAAACVRALRGDFVRTRLELVRERSELGRLAAGAMRECLCEEPVGEPGVARQQRPVQIRADRPAEPAAFVAALAVVAEAGHDTPERFRAGIELCGARRGSRTPRVSG